jgi:small subunit ribosomal protein S3
MKGEVYGKRDLSPLVGMDKKQPGQGGGDKRSDAPRGDRKPFNKDRKPGGDRKRK